MAQTAVGETLAVLWNNVAKTNGVRRVVVIMMGGDKITPYPLVPQVRLTSEPDLQDAIYKFGKQQTSGVGTFFAVPGLGKSCSVRHAASRLKKRGHLVYILKCDTGMAERGLRRSILEHMNVPGVEHDVHEPELSRMFFAPRSRDKQPLIILDQFERIAHDDDTAAAVKAIAEDSQGEKNFKLLVVNATAAAHEAVLRLNGGEKVYSIFGSRQPSRWARTSLETLYDTIGTHISDGNHLSERLQEDRKKVIDLVARVGVPGQIVTALRHEDVASCGVDMAELEKRVGDFAKEWGEC